MVSFFLLGTAVVVHVLLKHTKFGRGVFALGGNEKAAYYLGISTNKVTMQAYTLLGLCCGLAAMLAASRMNSVSSSQLGLMWELDAIAAVVIGGTRMAGGQGAVGGTVVGVLILGVIDNMLVMMGVSAYLKGLVKGRVILAAVVIQRQPNK